MIWNEHQVKETKQLLEKLSDIQETLKEIKESLNSSSKEEKKGMCCMCEENKGTALVGASCFSFCKWCYDLFRPHYGTFTPKNIMSIVKDDDWSIVTIQRDNNNPERLRVPIRFDTLVKILNRYPF